MKYSTKVLIFIILIINALIFFESIVKQTISTVMVFFNKKYPP